MLLYIILFYSLIMQVAYQNSPLRDLFRAAAYLDKQTKQHYLERQIALLGNFKPASQATESRLTTAAGSTQKMKSSNTRELLTIKSTKSTKSTKEARSKSPLLSSTSGSLGPSGR